MTWYSSSKTWFRISWSNLKIKKEGGCFWHLWGITPLIHCCTLDEPSDPVVYFFSRGSLNEMSVSVNTLVLFFLGTNTIRSLLKIDHGIVSDPHNVTDYNCFLLIFLFSKVIILDTVFQEGLHSDAFFLDPLFSV